MGKTVSSADISILDFAVLLDLSIANPYIKITNLSTVINAANLKWAFEVYSPGGVTIHKGDFTTPDIDGVAFTEFTFTEPIPKYFGQIEFSATNKFIVKVLVKDIADNIFDLSYAESVCKPNGNNGKNNFGAADIEMETKCAQGQLFVTDKTNVIYKNIEGTKVSTSLELTYPKDDSGNVLDPVVVTSIPALLPIKNDGEGHEIYAVHIYDYSIGTNFVVRIRYSYKKSFPVWCNITLQPLFCEIDPIVDMLEKACGNDTAEMREKSQQLGVINAKMLKAHTGIVQPLSGIDVPKLVEEIKGLLGTDCNCCMPNGISNVGALLVTDAVFTVNKVCGDMLLSWEQDEFGNIQLNYQNSTYTFVIADDSESEAFSYVPSTTGCNKQTALKVDISVLAQEIVTEFGNSQTLKDQLNAILQKAQLSCSGLDGGTIFNFSACEFSADVVSTPTGTVIDKIVINATEYLAPSGLLVTDTSGIVTWLNSLALGTFTATANLGAVKIATSANTNDISTISTSGTGGVKTYLFNSDCGLICSILQKIVTWLNDLGFVNVKSGQILNVCQFNTDGTVSTTEFAEDATGAQLAAAWSTAICNIVNYMKDKFVSCANVKAIFAAFTGTSTDPNGGDIVLGIKDGECQQIPIKNLGKAIFRLLQTDTDVKAIYCAGASCSTVSTCSPVTGLSGVVTDTTASYTWSAVAGATGYKWSIDGVTWNFTAALFANVISLTASTAYTFRM